MTTIANLRAKFSGDARGFNTAASSVSRGISRMGGAITALVGTAGLGAIVTQSLNAADRIQKLRDATGLSTEFLSAMRQGADLSGSSLDALSEASIRLQRRTVKAAQGSKEYALAFDALGISAERFAKLSPDDQIRAFSEAYSKLATQSEKNFVLTTLMGNAAAELGQFFGSGAAGIAKFEAQARATNQILDDDTVNAAAAANDAVKLLTETITGFGRNLALDFADDIVRVVEFLQDMINNLDAATRLFKAAGNLLGGVSAAVVAGYTQSPAAAREILGNIGLESFDILNGRDPAGTAGGARDEQRRTNELVAEQNRILEGVWVTLREGGTAVAR